MIVSMATELLSGYHSGRNIDLLQEGGAGERAFVLEILLAVSSISTTFPAGACFQEYKQPKICYWRGNYNGYPISLEPFSLPRPYLIPLIRNMSTKSMYRAAVEKKNSPFNLICLGRSSS